MHPTYRHELVKQAPAGSSDWLHHGWRHSCPAGHRFHCGSGPAYSGTKSAVAMWTFDREGEVSVKERRW